MSVQDINATRRLADAVTLPGGQRLPNRLMKSAMSEALGGPDHDPSPRLEQLYRRWGAGGFGLVVAGNVPISVTGGFRSRAAMADAVARRDCDLVGIGRPAVVHPAAAGDLLDGRRDRIETRQVRFGGRSIVGRFGDLRALDGLLDLNWHVDQMHRMARGLDPDPTRGWRRAALVMLARNGFGALRPRRSQ